MMDAFNQVTTMSSLVSNERWKDDNKENEFSFIARFKDSVVCSLTSSASFPAFHFLSVLFQVVDNECTLLDVLLAQYFLPILHNVKNRVKKCLDSSTST